jgi:glycosyltransferase involved in cell wall biosynthesis
VNILIYFPYNLRTVEQLSVMEWLLQKGHKVVLLTTTNQGVLHGLAEKMGVIAEADPGRGPGKLGTYLQHLRRLHSIIRAHRIELVVSHQQVPALLAGLLNLFRPFRHIYIRHNSDEDYLAFPVKARWLNRLVNALTPVKVAPSDKVARFWLEVEKVKKSEVVRINYGYNFGLYEEADHLNSLRIRQAYPARLLVLSIARLVPAKRHREMFAVMSRLKDSGVDCKLICLGSGPMAGELSGLVKKMNLEGVVFLEGRKENIFDYMTAADVVMHLSLTEASNSAVKEAGLCKKPVIVCKGVGDFGEYIVPGQNSFLVDKQYPEEEAYAILKAIADQQVDLVAMGERFYETVTCTFNIAVVGPAYERLLMTGKLTNLRT